MKAWEQEFRKLIARQHEPLICLCLADDSEGWNESFLRCLDENYFKLEAASADHCLLVILKSPSGIDIPQQRTLGGARHIVSLEAMQGFAAADGDVYRICTALGIPFRDLPALVLFERDSDRDSIAVQVKSLVARGSNAEDASEPICDALVQLLQESKDASLAEPERRLREWNRLISHRQRNVRIWSITENMVSDVVRGVVGAILDRWT